MKNRIDIIYEVLSSFDHELITNFLQTFRFKTRDEMELRELMREMELCLRKSDSSAAQTKANNIVLKAQMIAGELF